MRGQMKMSNFKRAILGFDLWTRSSKSTFLDGRGYFRCGQGCSGYHGNAFKAQPMNFYNVSQQMDPRTKLNNQNWQKNYRQYYFWTSRKTFSTSLSLQGDLDKFSTSSDFVDTTPLQSGPTLFECSSPQAALRWWSTALCKRGVPEAEVSAEFIVAHALGLKQLQELSSPVLARPLTQAALDTINGLCTKRMQRIPVQYIIGDWDFRDLTLVVRPPVFIPRPETEMLVDLVLGCYSEESNLNLLEVGCGSGAISLSLLSELPRAHVTAVDSSEEAVQLTMENAHRLGLQDRLTVHHAAVSSELPECLQGKVAGFDAVISNPPYVPTRDMKELQPEIKFYEDAAALCGGPDGMDVVRDIVRNAHLLLKRDVGSVWLETDSRHPDAIRAWLDTNPEMGVEFVGTFLDYHDRPRFTQMRYRPS